jgi:hypothetical protein
VEPLGLGYGTFDSDMVDLPVIVLTLSLSIEISVGTSGDCQDCAMGRECIELLQRLLNLCWRWWGRVGFSFDLVVGVVVWCRVCNLWHCGRVGYL